MKSPCVPLFLLYFSSLANGDKHHQVIKDVDSTKALRIFDGQSSDYILQQHLVQLIIRTSLLKNTRPVLRGGTCSGSIISESWILTAAHCFKSNEKNAKVHDMTVLVERLEHNTRVTLGHATKDNIIIHPGYIHNPSWPKSENDIAVLKTTEPLPLLDVIPIKLYKRPIKEGITITATVAGYGTTEFGPYYTDPRQGKVSVYNCAESYGQKLLCSNNLVRAGEGDSGGPLISKSRRLLGVISASCIDVHIKKRCETIYVEISYYLDWINNVTGVELV